MGFFDSVPSGDRAAAFKFGRDGESIAGVVKSVGKPFQGKGMDGLPETTKSGIPVYTLPVTISTAEDDRTIFIKGNSMTRAVRDALLNVGANDLALGMQLGLRRGDKVQTEQGYKAWTWEARIKLSE